MERKFVCSDCGAFGSISNLNDEDLEIVVCPFCAGSEIDVTDE